MFNRLYPKHLQIVSAAFVIVNLVACSSSPVQKPQQNPKEAALGRASVVMMGSLNLDPHKPTTISWLSPVAVAGEQDDAQAETLKAIVRFALQNQIAHKGYPLLNADGDYQMRALVVLGNGQPPHPDVTAESQDKLLAQSELMQRAGIDPGLVGGEITQGKGSLVIELRQGRALRWRGAVQIYLLPGSSDQITTERIEHAVAQLLFTWPE